jgi:hypothetical protein
MVQWEPNHWPVVEKGLHHHCEKRPNSNIGRIVNQRGAKASQTLRGRSLEDE